MPTPKSPLDKPSSSSSHSHSHSRRPSLARRSSSEKSSGTGKGSKHASKLGGSTSTKSKEKDKESMSNVSPGAQAPRKDGDEGTEGSDAIASALQSVYSTTSTGEGDAAQRLNTVRDSAEEIERLRQAMNAQLLLKAHREQLAQKMDSGVVLGDTMMTSAPGSGKKSRVSPIHEEAISPTPSFDGAFASPITSGLDTTSTESARTIRGGMTPAAVPRTPSYPFPSMRPPRQSSWTGHRPFTALSPTVNPTNYAGGTFATGNHHDEPLSGSATPGSAMNFQPPGESDMMEAPIFETPNLYELSLRLSYEPGLDAWWTTVVQLLREMYKAERITLAVPADSTDVENVPWGQKATYSAQEEDHLSLVYLPRGSSLVPSTSNDTSDSSTNPEEFPNLDNVNVPRPAMFSRHSYTAYEDKKREPEPQRASALRPTPLIRAKSYLAPRPEAVHRGPIPPNAELNLAALEEHEEIEGMKPQSAGWEEAQASSRENKGRIFPVLQALDYEADPLLDSGGVLRVLERGKVIALTRDYPYLDDPQATNEANESRGGTAWATGIRSEVQEKLKSGKAPEVNSRMANLLSGKRPSRMMRSLPSEKGKSLPGPARAEEEDRPPTPRYEEYEQAPPSPWAQSPAPSPAVRVETADNPFFAGIPVDEESFNPQAGSPDYSTSQTVEAIGIDRSWTVLHVPLIHPLLSKPVQSFRLDSAAMESRSAAKGQRSGLEKVPAQDKATEGRRTPIAILSILTPVIPYPANLRHSLSHLSAHLATSFSLCRHYSNLETELAGLSRKRPAVHGFGAIIPGKRSGGTPFLGTTLSASPSEEHGPRPSSLSTVGSITSSSEYSGLSRSATDSPLHTPNLDINQPTTSKFKVGPLSSPAINVQGETYFSAKSRPTVGRTDTGSVSGIAAARKLSKETSVLSNTSKSRESDKDAEGNSIHDVLASAHTEPLNTQGKAIVRKDEFIGPQNQPSERRESSPSRKSIVSPRRQTFLTSGTQSGAPTEKQHTQLHSYGADFGATFQSLPTNTSSTKPVAGEKPPSRSGSLSGPSEAPQHMLPPSDRLKGLMLDSLPAHVFVALPVTGEIVWVNNRYLTYRGQTVPELHANPWGTIHPDEREDYLKAWTHAIRTGEQFSKQVRIRRFDGNYRWFYTRAVGHRDIRGVIVQWYGSYMDIHDQHIAEVKAARQEEIEASEAKHRQLANLIPQIIFAATEDEGVTFANEQWLSYTGQGFEEALGLGFMNFVHPEDLAKCSIVPESAPAHKSSKPANLQRMQSQGSSGGNSSSNRSSNVSDTPTESTAKAGQYALSRQNSSSSGSFADFPIADLSQLARSGIIKSSTDSNGRLSYTTEIRLRSKVGEYRWHLVRCVEVDNISLGSGDGSWFGACTDINDHKLLETKLKDAMDSKTKFLSNMSHEIRTPLIGISGMVNFLQDTTLNDEQMDYANTIHASAKSLLNIINDILDLSKVDAGMMKLSYDWFHPRSLVEEVNEMVCTMAITKRLELNYIVDNDVPEMVKGDKFRIRQVLLNVVGNAIKFTTVGEVFSRCRVIRKTTELEDDEIMLEFSVIDTGRGFTKQEAELMFKPFSQIDGSSTRQHGGSGLGLVISRTLVELHGGKMEGSAVPGKGSTFVFTAKFGMATPEDHPELALTPQIMPPLLSRTSSLGGHQILTTAAAKRIAKEMVESPRGDSNPTSPAVLSSNASTASSRSLHSHSTHRSSGSSTTNLSHFGEAARSGSQDAATMKFSIPERVKSPTFAQSVPFGTQDDLYRTISTESDKSSFRPPMYSILLICPQTHSREATTQHIENTLPKDVPHQITPLSSIEEGRELYAGEDPINFTHIVLNLGVAEEIVSVIEMIRKATTKTSPALVILSDPVERQEVIRLGASYDYEQLAKDNRITFIYKPVKPSRFAVVFDPEKERDLSTDRNRFSAQQQVASQKQNYLDVAKRLGNKGFKVLLVEDNLVNQKVLLKYLSKIGIAVELALDGMECVEKVFAKPHSHYSLILCDLHMPRKDGYQTCREIRQWEKKNKYSTKPIIALSANVMADVLEKCVQAGFSNYVTKPVDFKTLSEVMGSFLDPGKGGVSGTLIR